MVKPLYLLRLLPNWLTTRQPRMCPDWDRRAENKNKLGSPASAQELAAADTSKAAARSATSEQRQLHRPRAVPTLTHRHAHVTSTTTARGNMLCSAQHQQSCVPISRNNHTTKAYPSHYNENEVQPLTPTNKTKTL